MTIKEALEEIKSQPKWYMINDENGKLIQDSSLIVMAQRIEDGRAKPSSITRFFKLFGYEVNINMEVTK